ncbi:MAG: hypothetical protein U5M50_10510 [Sphingobium sp.]|nr:hypothetical protein [Sphingobium sp.]
MRHDLPEIWTYAVPLDPPAPRCSLSPAAPLAAFAWGAFCGLAFVAFYAGMRLAPHIVAWWQS